MSQLALVLSFLGPLLLSKFLLESLSIHPTLLDRLVVFCLSWPIAREIRLRLQQRELGARASSRGAVLAPLVVSRLPFGLSVLLTRLRMIYSGSPGDVMDLFTNRVAQPTNSDKPTKVIRTRVMGVETIWTIDHDDAKYFLSTGFVNFGKSPFFKAGFRRLLGDGVFASDQRGLWAWHRSLTRPHFVRDRIADVVAMEEHSRRVASWLSAQTDLGKSVDVQDLFARYTLTVGTQHLFGRCVDSLNDLIHDRAQSGPNAADFAQNFVAAQHWAIINSLLPPLLISLGFGMRDKATEDVRQVVDTLVQDASLGLNSGTKCNELETDKVEGGISAENLLDHLLTSGCSKELVRHECLNILLAARDTTASLLSSCVYELARESARKPEMWRMLKEEVERLGSGIDGLLTLDQVREMRYLRAVLNETLRIHPPVWANTRHAFEDDVLPSGVFVPAGTDCRFFIREFHRNPEVWGKDADEFDPDRWIDSRKALQVKDPFSFQPFSAGPRICLGQQFGPVGAEAPAVVLTFRGGLQVRFRR
uniref:Putative cytochrome P450 n=1 Tax=Puccinia horiana TaxID=331382 RepID=W8FWR9_9BASI|nr:putative cytochrome P450 [Puccinia horiana]